jgi:hypothetical protein
MKAQTTEVVRRSVSARDAARTSVCVRPDWRNAGHVDCKARPLPVQEKGTYRKKGCGVRGAGNHPEKHA